MSLVCLLSNMQYILRSCTTVDWAVSNLPDNLLKSRCRGHISHHHKIWAQIRIWVNVKAELSLSKSNAVKYMHHRSSHSNPFRKGNCIELPNNATFFCWKQKIFVYSCLARPVSGERQSAICCCVVLLPNKLVLFPFHPIPTTTPTLIPTALRWNSSSVSLTSFVLHCPVATISSHLPACL